MAEIFNFYVQDNRSIQFPKNNLLEPIMQEDHNVAIWRFRIPKVLNDIDMSAWAWWFVYINAKGQEFSELLTLVDDVDEPDSFCTADFSIDYGISKNPGEFTFALEADNVDGGGEILNEWHTKTYKHKVDKTLQGNHAEFAETESDIISALIIEVQNKMRQLVGGATPEPKNLVADMIETAKVYLYVGSEEDESNGYWYYHNGTRFVPGGQYGAGVTDAVPTQGSNNAVSSGGVYDALRDVDAITDEVKQALLACFQHVAWIDGHGQNYYDALESALYADTPDIPVISWDYSLGRVPSSADGITTATTGSKTITFNQSRGVYITGGSGSSENIRFVPTEYPTCKKAYCESVFTITEIEDTGSYVIRLSNGINGVNYIVGMVYENNVLVFRLMYKTGDNDTTVVIPQFIPEFNTEYKIRIEYEDGGTNKVYINDALIHETQDIATKWTTENRAMAVGGVSVYIKSMKWGIEEA